MEVAEREARIAGFCYLFVIAGGIFAAVFVRESLFAPEDAAATARAIAANETHWRWGIAVHALYLLAAATVGVILYRLLRPAGATLALLALVFTLADVAIEAVLLTLLLVPLLVSGESGALAALDGAQREAFGHLAIRLFFGGWAFGLLLFSGFCALVGVLILRSRVIPGLVGALMIAAGASYFINSVAGIVSPPLVGVLFPWIMLPPLAGELSLALWLSVKGVKRSEVSEGGTG